MREKDSLIYFRSNQEPFWSLNRRVFMSGTVHLANYPWLVSSRSYNTTFLNQYNSYLSPKYLSLYPDKDRSHPSSKKQPFETNWDQYVKPQLIKIVRTSGHMVLSLSWYRYNKTHVPQARETSQKQWKMTGRPRRTWSIQWDCVSYKWQRSHTHGLTPIWLPKHRWHQQTCQSGWTKACEGSTLHTGL